MFTKHRFSSGYGTSIDVQNKLKCEKDGLIYIEQLTEPYRPGADPIKPEPRRHIDW